MDSLLANYASSDDEEQQQQPPPPSSVSALQRSELSEPSSSKSSSFFSSLPPPKSSSLFQSLPQPNQSSKPSLPTGFFENDENEDVEEGDSVSTSKLGADSIKPSSLFPSLPRPKGNPTSSSSSLSSSRFDGDGDGDGNLTKSVSLFSSLPQPNLQKLQKPKSNPSSSESQPKRIVLFKPPVNSSLLKLGEDDDDDDEEEEEEEEIRRRKASQSSFQTPSVTSFLSSIPAPKHSTTLGVISSSGSGRRSTIETDVPVSSSDDSKVVNDSRSTQKVDHGAENYDSYINYSSGVEQNVASQRENYDNAATHNYGAEQNTWNYASYDSCGNYHYYVDQNVVGEAQSVSGASNAGAYGSYENYGNYGDHIQHGSDPAGQPSMVDAENAVRIPEKRRRNEIPSEILEVKQDELIKNRPRQDQVKLTGIAFGPSYQPASSTKGKPSKLHKRKHQITSLYYDMKQKEMELAERRARGLLTKAETQAKYGW